MLDNKTFLWGMAFLQRAVPTFKPVSASNGEPGTFDAFYLLLKDLDPEVFKSACARVATDEEFVSVRALRKAAESLSNPYRRSGIEAWGDVLEQVRDVGYIGQPRFSDPIVAHIVKSMGWKNICLDEDVMVMRAHFIKSYETVSAREHDTARQIPEVQQRIESLSGPRKMGEVLKQLSGGRNGDKV